MSSIICINRANFYKKNKYVGTYGGITGSSSVTLCTDVSLLHVPPPSLLYEMEMLYDLQTLCLFSCARWN